MLAAVKMVQGVAVEKRFQIGFPADHMLARSDENSTWTKHAVHFAACAVEIAGVVQHRSRKHDVERLIGKRQALGELFDHFDRQPGFGRKRANSFGPDEAAGIGLERGHCKSFSSERIACDAPSGADVEGPAAPALQ